MISIGISISIIFLMVGIIVGIYIKSILKIKKKIDIYTYKENDISYLIIFKVDYIGQNVDIEFVSRTQNNKTIRYFHPRINYEFSDIIIANINGTDKNKYVYNYFHSISRFIKNELLRKFKININDRKLSDVEIKTFIDKIITDKRSSITGWTTTSKELDKLLKNSII